MGLFPFIEPIPFLPEIQKDSLKKPCLWRSPCRFCFPCSYCYPHSKNKNQVIKSCRHKILSNSNSYSNLWIGKFEIKRKLYLATRDRRTEEGAKALHPPPPLPWDFLPRNKQKIYLDLFSQYCPPRSTLESRPSSHDFLCSYAPVNTNLCWQCQSPGSAAIAVRIHETAVRSQVVAGHVDASRRHVRDFSRLVELTCIFVVWGLKLSLTYCLHKLHIDELCKME